MSEPDEQERPDDDAPPPKTPVLDFLEALALKLQAFGEWLLRFVR